MHAHDFRSADEFKGKDVLIVGASYSAEDIGLQCHKYGAKSVTMCWRTQPMGFHWPETMDERPLLTKIEGRTVFFKDGSSKDFDAIILCTGYQHHFPFLDDELKLRTHNRMHPPHLYKGIFWLDNPKLIYLGMQDQFYTFSMFDAQAWYARDVILGRIKLPSKEEMQKDDDAWVKREEALKDAFEKIDFQADYVRELCDGDRLSEIRHRHDGRRVQGVGARQGAFHPRLPQQGVQIALHGNHGAGSSHAVARSDGRLDEGVPCGQGREGRRGIDLPRGVATRKGRLRGGLFSSLCAP